jgi:hypothetical protein
LENIKIIDGKKYMWDGEEYESESDAENKITTYNDNGFQTKLIIENEQYLVYTRREVSEIKVEEQSEVN